MEEGKIIPKRQLLIQLTIGLVSIVIIPILVIVLLLSEQNNLMGINQELTQEHLQDTHYILHNKIQKTLENHPSLTPNLKEISWEELLPEKIVEYYIVDSNYELIYSPLEEESFDQLRPSLKDLANENFEKGLISEIQWNNNELGYLIIFPKEVLLETRRPYFYILILIPLFVGSILFFKFMHQGLYILSSYYDHIHNRYEQASYEKDIYLDKYLRSERLITMGRFASGIAHEIGNPLASIISSTEILKKYDLNLEEKDEYYNQILNDSYKIDTLLKEFLDFRKHKEEIKTKADINGVILDAISQVSVLRENKNIELITDLAKDLPQIIVDESRMKMVFTNLIKNAYQSIEGQGFIQIRSLKIENGIRIRIRDSGKGISQKDMENIFTPFFTTKDIGEGFGLGLFITMQIIHAHKGKLKVESNVGEGSIFTIDLISKREEGHE